MPGPDAISAPGGPARRRGRAPGGSLPLAVEGVGVDQRRRGNARAVLLQHHVEAAAPAGMAGGPRLFHLQQQGIAVAVQGGALQVLLLARTLPDRKSTRLNS